MYRHGYFRQRVDHTGWQQEFWVPTDPERSPAVLVTSGDARLPLRITVPVGDELVAAQVWRVDVGRVPLFLLDTDLPQNSRVARWITARLYDSDRRTRLAQYVVLGVGGAPRCASWGSSRARAHERGPRRVRRARDGRRPRARRRVVRGAFEDVRRHTVFTTHTRCRPATTRTRPTTCAPRWRRWRGPPASTPRRSSASGARVPTTSTSRSA